MNDTAIQYARVPHWGYVILTMLLALLLSVIPLPENVKNYWPDWISLLVFYWVLVLPAHLGVMFGWTNGLLEDIISFSLLGEHAIGKALIGAVVAMTSQNVKRFNFIERMFMIFILQSINIAIISWANLLAFDTPIHSVLWQPALTTALAWPLVAFLLDQFDPGLN